MEGKANESVRPSDRTNNGSSQVRIVRTILLLAFVFPGQAASVSWGAEQPIPRDLQVQEEFEVFNDGDWLLVPVKIQGHTYPFALDTGCSATVIDISLIEGSPVDKLELPGADGNIAKKLDLYKASPMQIGKIAWQSEALVAGEDLSQMRDVSGHKLYGLLGMDFLRNYAVQIDFDRGKVLLLQSPAPPSGHSSPIIFLDYNSPWVVGDMFGWGPELFNIDTGYSMGFGCLKKELFRALARKGVIRSLSESKACGIFGINKAFGGIVEKFSLDEKLQPCPMGLDESPFVYSLLGLQFWRRYNLTLDFPRQTIYLQRSHWFHEEGLFDLSGIHFIRKKGSVIVEEISEGSPAAQAGLRPGDVLTKIGDKNPAETRLLELWKILGKDGDKVSIVFRRGDTRKEVELLLKPWERKEPSPAFLKEEKDYEAQASLLVQRGIAFGHKKNLDKAIGDFDEAIRLNPKFAMAYNSRGDAWIHKGKLDKALLDYNEAIHLDPKIAMVYGNRGNTWLNKQEFDRAIKDCDEAIRLNTKYAMAYSIRGTAWMNKQELDKAISDYTEAIRLDPKLANAYFNRATILFNRRDIAKALFDFHDASRLDPKLAPAFYGKACCYAVERKTERAIDNLRQALELGYRDFDAISRDTNLNSIRNDPAFEQLMNEFAK
jgi:tetratricopeptide (TPR) repeat protein